MKPPWVLILSHDPRHLNPPKFPDFWASNSETYTILGFWGLCKRARHKRDGCFFLSGWKLDGSRLTYSWLWFRLGKTNIYLATSSPPPPIYIQYVSTNRHVKYSRTACGRPHWRTWIILELQLLFEAICWSLQKGKRIPEFVGKSTSTCTFQNKKFQAQTELAKQPTP